MLSQNSPSTLPRSRSRWYNTDMVERTADGDIFGLTRAKLNYATLETELQQSYESSTSVHTLPRLSRIGESKSTDKWIPSLQFVDSCRRCDQTSTSRHSSRYPLSYATKSYQVPGHAAAETECDKGCDSYQKQQLDLRLYNGLMACANTSRFAKTVGLASDLVCGEHMISPSWQLNKRYVCNEHAGRYSMVLTIGSANKEGCQAEG